MEKCTTHEITALIVHNAYSLAGEFERREPNKVAGEIIVARLLDLLKELPATNGN